ncbi:hypothetical protein [Candidatus Magnetaquicoccus inordinatus]|uniref:hypothetical protein n=1 Tax=Candidatus Magnetaquicoccus inordinatus TaxID=2496818 RepID=UPI00102CD336|nr:hypothetical protein [Candidatus Magnetaquicoccus inordinatus]
MSHPPKEAFSILTIPAAQEKEGCPPPEAEESSARHRPSSEEEWRLNKAAIARLSRNGQWSEVLEILTALSKKQKTHEIYKALAQRVWVALKSDVPVTDVVLALFHLLNTLGPRHEIAGPIVALAHLMAKHRTPEHPDAALAQAQSQQMFSLVLDAVGIVGDEAFAKWVEHHHLDDPNHYIPIVLRSLEIMVGDDWWFDRDDLQQDGNLKSAKRKGFALQHPGEKTLQ